MFMKYLILITTCPSWLVAGIAPNQEIIEQGRTQYQLLKNRETIPRYGTCWKSAIEHLAAGCRLLTEDTQSDVALHLTNCFLDMSGHETYSCELDKKRNLRAICIGTMSDRAFNVYTEFYTHTQNMCWFLQGHVWQEIMSESTMQVGRQLRETAANQADLLEAQRESLELQGRMLEHGRFLERTLQGLYEAFGTHREVLEVLSGSVEKLQAWVVGEVSWLDSVVFYTVGMISIFLFSAAECARGARLPVFLMLLLNVALERLICTMHSYHQDVEESYNNIYYWVWVTRYGFIVLAVIFFVYTAVVYQNPVMQQYKLLSCIQKQNDDILKILRSKNQLDLDSSNLSYTNECQGQKDQTNNKELFLVGKTHLDYSRTCDELENKRYNLRSNTPIK